MVYGTNYEVAVCPDGRAQARSIGFIDALAVSKGAKQPNQAWDFVRWMVMDGERFAQYQIAVGSVPLLMPVVEDPYYEGEGEFMKVFMAQPLWQEPHHKHFYELKTKFGGYLERVFYQKMTLDEAFAKAEEEATDILARTY
jgi:ABC-type glycerol-3-phosphate transport system substrate-binding protein